MYADYDSIVSVLESQDTRQEMVTNNQVDSLGNIIKFNRVYTQDQEKNNFKRPFTILVEGNVGSGNLVLPSSAKPKLQLCRLAEFVLISHNPATHPQPQPHPGNFFW